MVFCPKCGNELPDDAAFCGKCGAKMEPRGSAGQEAAPVAPEAASAAVAAAPKGKLPVKAIIIAAAAVAVAVVAAAVVYFNLFAPYEIDEKNFSDPAVRAAIAKSVDRDNDGKVSRDEAKANVSLDLSGKDVSSLDGLELLTGLTGLDLSGSTGLYTVDVSKVTALEKLDITGSEVGSVDTTKLPNLVSLKAKDSGLQSVDLSACSALSELQLDDEASVTGLDATKVRAQYLPKRVEVTGNSGFEDVNGIGSGMTEKSVHEVSYDDEGRPVKVMTTEWLYASAGGDVYTTTGTFTYEGDKLTRYESVMDMSRYTTTNTYGFEYDTEGRLTSSTRSTSGGSSSTTTTTTERYTYDDAGKMVAASTSGSYSASKEYAYDDAGRVTSQSYKSSSMSLRKQASVDSYDDAGRVTQMTDLNSLYRFNFVYDDAGRCVERDRGVLKSSDSTQATPSMKNTYEYDAQGRVTSAKREGVSDSGSDAWEATCTYDENGMLSSRVLTYTGKSSNPVGEGTTTFEYTRFFTAADADDLHSLFVLDDPLSPMRQLLPNHESLLPEGQVPQVSSLYVALGYLSVFYYGV